MAIGKSITFLLRAVTAGLALAFLYVLVVQPGLLRGAGNVVEVKETPAPTQPAPGIQDMSGPVSYADAVARAGSRTVYGPGPAGGYSSGIAT